MIFYFIFPFIEKIISHEVYFEVKSDKNQNEDDHNLIFTEDPTRKNNIVITWKALTFI